MKEEKEEKEEKAQDRKVHCTVLYTLTGEEKNFVAEPGQLFKDVIDEAYRKLGESPRTSDQYFCHGAVRHDLAPYFSVTLQDMQKKGVCIRDNGHGKQEFDFDIEAEVGGAASV